MTDKEKVYLNATSLLFAGLAAVLVVALVLYLWDRLDKSGHIPHDEITIVYSPNWQVGEYRNCTTLNGNGYRSPEHASRPQNMLCNGGVPSGRVEEGKRFKVRFWGLTYTKSKGLYDLLVWNCRKNSTDEPAFSCKQDARLTENSLPPL
jgi:hypothetical protein